MTAQVAPQSSITVGDMRVTYLPDGEGHVPATGATTLHERGLGGASRMAGRRPALTNRGAAVTARALSRSAAGGKMSKGGTEVEEL